MDAISLSGSTVFMGGSFDGVNGETRRNIAAIDMTTGNPTGWNPDASSAVLALVVSGSNV